MAGKFKTGDVLQLIDETKWEGRWAGKLTVVGSDQFLSGCNYTVKRENGDLGSINEVYLKLYVEKEDEFKPGVKVKLTKTMADQGYLSEWLGEMTVISVNEKNTKLIRCNHPQKCAGTWFRDQLEIVKEEKMTFKYGDEVELLPGDYRRDKYGKLTVNNLDGNYVICYSSKLGYKVSFFPEKLRLVKLAETFRVFVGPVVDFKTLEPYSQQTFTSVKAAEDFVKNTAAKDKHDEIVILQVVKTLKKVVKKTEKVVVEETVKWE